MAKFYAVKEGKKTGIFLTWDECRKQVHGASGAIYKSFSTRQEAVDYINGETTPQIPLKAQEMPEDAMTAYVDGSYNVETKEFSYGMVVFYKGEKKCFSQKVEMPELASMRNVAGEIKGAEAAMRYAVEMQCDQLIIYHDYEGISRWCLGDWKANKEGTKDYKKFYDSIKEQVKITFVKVKGHSNDENNDLADELAKQALFTKR